MKTEEQKEAEKKAFSMGLKKESLKLWEFPEEWQRGIYTAWGLGVKARLEYDREEEEK